VQDFGFGSLHHLDDPASNLQPMITPEESELIDRLITECDTVTDSERLSGTPEFDIYGYVNDLVKLYGLTSCTDESLKIKTKPDSFRSVTTN
jgi:hypothetical protein